MIHPLIHASMMRFGKNLFSVRRISRLRSTIKSFEVLNTTSPNVYIYTGVGHQVIPDEHRDLIREAIPSAAEQLTGQRYTGRIESGTDHLVERVGWITVRYFTDADQHGSCGFTRVGADPNSHLSQP